MNIETERFREGKINRMIPCGMVSHPFLKGNKCTELAAVIVTDRGWHTYQNYRIRATRYMSKYTRKQLPIMMRPLLCLRHVHYIENLPENPRDAGKVLR